MATTRIVDPSRPVATPIPGALWEGDIVDVTKIPAELRRLWLQVGDGVTVGADAHDGPRDVTILVRATTLNLVAVTRDKAVEEETIAAVLAMSDFHPSRATILFADPARTDPADDSLHVRAMLVEQAATRSRPVVRFELVVVEGSAANEPTLASVVAPLLVVALDIAWTLAARLLTRTGRARLAAAGSWWRRIDAFVTPADDLVLQRLARTFSLPVALGVLFAASVLAVAFGLGEWLVALPWLYALAGLLLFGGVVVLGSWVVARLRRPARPTPAA